MRTVQLFGSALLCTALSLAASAQGLPSFKASAKAQGAPFDLVATETDRLPTKSYLDVPGFHERTAPATRWLMCVYTALAVERGFTRWWVVYPAEGRTRVVVGLTNDAGPAPQVLFGPDYDATRLLGDAPMPVTKMADMCGDLSAYKS